MEIFEQKYIVELADITPNFGLEPIAVLKYYQETFARYCAKYGVAGYDVFKMGLKWVLGQTNVEYFDVIPIWNEEVTAKVWISAVKKLRMYFSFEVSTSRGLVAKGQSIAYVLDLETSRPQLVGNIVNHFDIDLEVLKNDILSYEFVEKGDLISEQEHKITFSDVDYNNHTNNIAYLALAFEGMGADYIEKNYPKQMEIKYLQETFLEDVLKCQICKNGDVFEYNIVNTKDESLVCLIKTSWQQNSLNHEKFYEILDELKHEKVTC